MSTIEQLEPWQREDGIVMRSAALTFDLIPRTRHNRPGVRLAREIINPERNR
jgi:hypothetical protein